MSLLRRLLLLDRRRGRRGFRFFFFFFFFSFFFFFFFSHVWGYKNTDTLRSPVVGLAVGFDCLNETSSQLLFNLGGEFVVCSVE